MRTSWTPSQEASLCRRKNTDSQQFGIQTPSFLLSMFGPRQVPWAFGENDTNLLGLEWELKPVNNVCKVPGS
jgi:hypothetical protein